VSVIIFEENDQEGDFQGYNENQMYNKKSVRSYYSSYKKTKCSGNLLKIVFILNTLSQKGK